MNSNPSPMVIGGNVIPFPLPTRRADSPPLSPSDDADEASPRELKPAPGCIFTAIDRHRVAVDEMLAAIDRQKCAEDRGVTGEALDEIADYAISDEGDAAKALANTIPADLGALVAMLAYIETVCRRGGNGAASFTVGWLEPAVLRAAGAGALAIIEANGGRS
jgi:hypothetical protein